ncbi:MAG TPA: hypothetical protein DIC53_07595 [Synergistaceae bacterium]|nr:hypothetical protein [Synergistaceae bacterium]
MEFLESFTGLHLPWWGWSVVLLSGAGVAFGKAAVPGSGILIVTLLATVLPSRMSTAVMVPLVIAGDFFAAKEYWRYADRRELAVLVPSGLLGLGVGYLILRCTTDAQLKPMIGWLVLVMLAIQQITAFLAKRGGRNKRTEGPRENPWIISAFGVLAGTATGMANASGPILGMYLLWSRREKLPYLGVTACLYVLLDLLKIPMHLSLGTLTVQSLKVGLVALPSLFPGLLLSFWVVRRFSQDSFRKAVLFFTLLATMNLLL